MSDAIRKFDTSFGDTLWIVLAIILVIVMLFCNKKEQTYDFEHEMATAGL